MELVIEPDPSVLELVSSLGTKNEDGEYEITEDTHGMFS